MIFQPLGMQIILEIKNSGNSCYNCNKHLSHAANNSQWYGLNAFPFPDI